MRTARLTRSMAAAHASKKQKTEHASSPSVSEIDAFEFNKVNGHLIDKERKSPRLLLEGTVVPRRDLEKYDEENYGGVMLPFSCELVCRGGCGDGDFIVEKGQPGIILRDYMAAVSKFSSYMSKVKCFGSVLGTGGSKSIEQYKNVYNYNQAQMKNNTFRCESRSDIEESLAKIEGLSAIVNVARRLHPSLSLLIMDLLRQYEGSSTSYGFHLDTDESNNCLRHHIKRTVIIKVTEGPSQMQVAGWDVSDYGEEPGCGVDFRSGCYHKSLPPKPGSPPTIKLVLFFGKAQQSSANPK